MRAPTLAGVATVRGARGLRVQLNRNQLVCWGDGACEAELRDLACEAAGLGFGRGASKMVWAEILVEGAVAKHVVGGGQDGSRYGADGLLGAAAVAQALELSLKVAALFACAGPGALHQRGLEPRRPFAQPGGAALAGALVIAGAEPGPGDQVAGKRLMSMPISETMTCAVRSLTPGMV